MPPRLLTGNLGGFTKDNHCKPVRECALLRGSPLSGNALQRLVARHVTTARRACASLTVKSPAPRALHHAAAINLLRHGVELTVIALCLGHEPISKRRRSTQTHIHADTRLKELALAHATASGATPERYRPPDALMTFLEILYPLDTTTTRTQRAPPDSLVRQNCRPLHAVDRRTGTG